MTMEARLTHCVGNLRTWTTWPNIRSAVRCMADSLLWKRLTSQFNIIWFFLKSWSMRNQVVSWHDLDEKEELGGGTLTSGEADESGLVLLLDPHFVEGTGACSSGKISNFKSPERPFLAISGWNYWVYERNFCIVIKIRVSAVEWPVFCVILSKTEQVYEPDKTCRSKSHIFTVVPKKSSA